MVYQVTTDSSEYTNDNGTTGTLERKVVANELSNILKQPDDFYPVLDCTFDNVSQHYSYHAVELNKNGHTNLYRTNKDEDYGTSGRIAVSYLNSQKIYGKGWKIKSLVINGTYKNIRQEIEFFAVKVSDEELFSLSDDLDYSSYSVEDNEFNQYNCIGLQEHNYLDKADGVETSSYRFQYFQQHGEMIDDFEIHDGKSINVNPVNNQTIGVRRRHFSPSKSIDNFCYSSDLECVNKYSLQSEILQNNSSGISFTANLTGNEDLNNEVYIDAQVSVIIHPFEAAPEAQE
jgi:hypothetical protein